MEGMLAKPTNLHANVTRNRLAVQKLRNGTPKLKDVLRERFQIRIREKRQVFFNKLRNGPSNSDLKDICSQSISKELRDLYEKQKGNELDEKEICDAIATLEEIQKEILAEEELMMMEFNTALSCEASIIEEILAEDHMAMLCPLCKKGFMTDIAHPESSGSMSCCNCNARIQAKVSLQEMEAQISFCVNIHSKVCSSVPDFVVTPEQDSSALLMVCSKCNYSNTIV